MPKTAAAVQPIGPKNNNVIKSIIIKQPFIFLKNDGGVKTYVE